MQSHPFMVSFFRGLGAIDLYGQDFFLPVSTNKRYSTRLGIALTLMTFAIMISYGIYKANIFFERSSYQVISSTFNLEINDTDPEIIEFASLGFDFAFSMTVPLPEEIGSIELAIMKQVKVTNPVSNVTYFEQHPTNIPFEKCTNETFNTTGLTENEKQTLENYYCFANKSEVKFGGDTQSNLLRGLQVNLFLCQNSTNSSSNKTCETPENQAKYFAYSALKFQVRNQYFDSTKREDFIRSYLDQQYIFPVVDGLQQIGYIPMRKSQVQISGIYPWETDYIIDFAQAQRLLASQAVEGYRGNTAAVTVNFLLDCFTDVYQKQQYSFMDFLSEVGGLFNSVIFLGKVISVLFVTNSYLAYIASHLYFVDGQATNAKDDELISNAMQKIVNTERIRAGVFVQLKYFLCCIFLKKINQKDFRAKKSEILLEHAKDKFCQEFDLIEVLKSLQELRSLKNHLLSRSEQILLSFQHQFYLDDSLNPLQELELTRKFISQDPLTKSSEVQKFSSNLLSRIEKGQISEIGMSILKGVANCEEERSQILDKRSIFGMTQQPNLKSIALSLTRKEESKAPEQVGFRKKKIEKCPISSKQPRNEFFKDTTHQKLSEHKNSKKKKYRRAKKEGIKDNDPLS